MKNSVTDRLGPEHRKKERRIALLNDATQAPLTLPTPQSPRLEGRWV
jgi:hypothetical protein